jgi:hypothetical protein
MLTIDKPRDTDIHTISDFAELLCLVTPDRVCSRETISDYARDAGDYRMTDVVLDDCFNQLSWRVSAYGAHYPFRLDERGRVLSAREELTQPQKLYALLLICANLPFVDVRDGTLTDAFERIALLALRAAWPFNGMARAFGKNETDYTGAKWERLNKLAEDIGGAGACTEHTFRARDSGDGGIDLAAWLDLDSHEKRNIPSALAQCACSRENWTRKQNEISEDRLRNSIHGSHRWNQILLIPQSFRDNLGKWAVPGDIGGIILFDRLRIIRQLGDAIDWARIAPPPIFNAILEERLALV